MTSNQDLLGPGNDWDSGLLQAWNFRNRSQDLLGARNMSGYRRGIVEINSIVVLNAKSVHPSRQNKLIVTRPFEFGFYDLVEYLIGTFNWF